MRATRATHNAASPPTSPLPSLKQCSPCNRSVPAHEISGTCSRRMPARPVVRDPVSGNGVIPCDSVGYAPPLRSAVTVAVPQLVRFAFSQILYTNVKIPELVLWVTTTAPVVGWSFK